MGRVCRQPSTSSSCARTLSHWLLLPVALLQVHCSAAEREPDKAPHIFLIVFDTLCADHLSLNGYARETSPTLDRFARTASHFRDAVSVIPKTCPSMATMLSGLHPAEHGVRSNLDFLPDTAPWLPEILQERGYRTVALVSNPVLQRLRGFDRGFDLYRNLPSAGGVEAVNRAFDALPEDDFEQPTFVWLHYIDPHGPYDPPAGYASMFKGDELSRSDARVPLDYDALPGYHPSKILGALPKYQRQGDDARVASYIRRYDAEIRYVDAALSRLLQQLDARGLLETSVVVLTSDHGESLGEHDYFFEHGWYAYDASLRIPLLVHTPEMRDAEERTELVSNLDLFPTLLGLAGIENRWDGQGRDLLAPLPRDHAVVVENSGGYPESYVGLRTGDRKYLRERNTGREALYHLDADPGESSNRIADDPEGAERARERTRKALARMRPKLEAPKRPRRGTPEFRKELESLGYLVEGEAKPQPSQQRGGKGKLGPDTQ
jgi:arylsulfatase A-like enzyme